MSHETNNVMLKIRQKIPASLLGQEPTNPCGTRPAAPKRGAHATPNGRVV